VPETVEERERIAFDQGMGTAFDQGQFLQTILGEQALVAQADEPVGHVVRVQADVLGFEFLAAAPEVDGDVEQDAFTSQHVQQWI